MSADAWSDCPKCKAPEKVREDYEFCLFSDGQFLAEYRGECQACGWIFKFKHEEQACQPQVNSTT